VLFMGVWDSGGVGVGVGFLPFSVLESSEEFLGDGLNKALKVLFGASVFVNLEGSFLSESDEGDIKGF